MDRFFRSAHAGEHPSITVRRSFEDSRVCLDSAQSVSLKLLEHAEWERRSNGIVRANKVQRAVQQRRLEDDSGLAHRRRRLQGLLEAEDAQLQAELDGLTESAEARKQRVVAEALRLKAERERVRDAAARDGYDRQWKERCDELRTIDSHAFALHCAQRVEQQMADNAQRRAALSDEERLQAETWERLRVDRVRAEDDKQRSKKEATKDNRRALEEEVTRHRQLDSQQKEKEAKEKEITVRAERTDSTPPTAPPLHRCAALRRGHSLPRPLRPSSSPSLPFPLLSSASWPWTRPTRNSAHWRSARGSASRMSDATHRSRRTAPASLQRSLTPSLSLPLSSLAAAAAALSLCASARERGLQ